MMISATHCFFQPSKQDVGSFCSYGFVATIAVGPEIDDHFMRPNLHPAAGYRWVPWDPYFRSLAHVNPASLV